MRRDRVDVVIGIDPDVDKSGVAFLEVATRRLEVTTLTFPQLLDYLREEKKKATSLALTYVVCVEAGWKNAANWHWKRNMSRAAVAKVGENVGRCHEVGRKIVEVLDHWKIPYAAVRPLVKHWSGRDGKITQEELEYFTNISGRTNQEGRDAALIAWTYAKLPVRKKISFNKYL